MRIFFVLATSLLINCVSVSQVVINEVMPKPSNAGNNCDQSLVNTSNPACGKEYIELYNTNSCDSIDISCYLIASKTSSSSGGAFAFPNGTVIPPLGHLVVGAPNSSATAGSVDLLLSDYIGQSNLCQTDRWFLENQNGWLAFYDPSGNVVDAIYWTFNPNQQSTLLSNVAFSYTPCSPASCFNGLLKPASQMIIGAEINYLGEITSMGFTYSRIPDGGSWQREINPSIAGSNNCNNGTCNTVSQAFQLNATVTQPSCSIDNGSITFNQPTLATYNWNPNVSTGNSASGLASGDYLITITSGGCSKDTVISLDNNSPTSIAVSVNNSACSQSNGSVTLGVVDGGLAPYEFNFNSLGFSTNTIYTGLSAGSYPLIVKDANGCEFIAPAVVLTSVQGPNSATINSTNPSCGQSNGSIVINSVNSGTAPYQYNFNSQGFSSTSNYLNLSSGNFSLVIKDANGCEYTSPLLSLINNAGPSSATINFTNPTCGQNNGTITIISISGGTSPYQYNFNTQGFSTSTNYSNLAPGNYLIEVRDANGCLYSASPVVLANSIGPTSISVNGIDPTCNSNNGSVTINSTNGGVAPYQYNFNSQGFSVNTTYSGLPAGIYPLIVRDANGCIYTAPNVVLTSIQAPTNFNVSSIPAYCSNANGSLSITGVNGGISPYQYSINNQSYNNTNNFNNLSEGTYTLSVIDANGCSINKIISLTTTTISINFATEISLPSCEGGDGTFKITQIRGGTAPYQFTFNNLVNVSSPNFINLSSGVFPLIITDKDGCTNSFSIEIPETEDDYFFYIPNSFTPNGDNLNDEWFFYTNCISNYKCHIYNRWGESIVILDESNPKWDGKYENNYVQNDTYVYVIFAKKVDNISIVKKGIINLLR